MPRSTEFPPRLASLLLVLVLSSCQQKNVCAEKRLPAVAVIGAGIGGTSSALYFRQLFGPDVDIDVYELAKVGGRLATVKFDGTEYEAGGSKIHWKNQYLTNFTKLLNLKRLEWSEAFRFGIFDGEQFAFKTSSRLLLSMLSVFWRYGFELLDINQLVSNNMDRFDKIYRDQQTGIAFTTVANLLESMNPFFLNLTKMSLKDYLARKGYSENFIIEYVMGETSSNYGQTIDIHAFAGLMSLACSQKYSWSVEGGNFKVPEGLLEKSGARLIHASVDKIIPVQCNESGIKYHLRYTPSLDDHFLPDEASKVRVYDIVVIAMPLNQNTEKTLLEDFPPLVVEEYFLSFHRTVATFVHGVIDASFFGSESEDTIPEDVRVNNQSVFFNNLKKGLLSGKKTKSKDVWKMLSGEILNEVQEQLLFRCTKHSKVVDWLAYPSYRPVAKLLPFSIANQLYYVNAIEAAASTMEMSVIGGRNVALLAFNQWYNRLDKIDPFPKSKDGKTYKEL